MFPILSWMDEEEFFMDLGKGGRFSYTVNEVYMVLIFSICCTDCMKAVDYR